MWTYNQSSGQLSKDGIVVDTDCYSGAFPDGFNDPAKQEVPDVGPIPCGLYTICGPPFSDTEHGPYILRLEPDAANVMFGRVGFLLHGKPLPPRDIRSGSQGCICAGAVTRTRVYQSGDTRLTVISGLIPIDPEIQV
jgi:hypothetical protein